MTTLIKQEINRIENEVGTQADLIAQIQTALAGKAAAPDTSDATATAGDILSGKTAYAQGRKITGTIESRDGSDLSVNGAYVLVSPGYYADGCQANVSEAEQATPSISVSSAGKITASATQTEGYVSAGTKSATKQLTTQAAKSVTPTTADQTAVASGVYTTGAVKVKGDANLKADNIKSGVSIFGVAGTYEGSGGSGGGGLEELSVTVTDNGMSEPGTNEYILDVPGLNLSTRQYALLLAKKYANGGNYNYCLMFLYDHELTTTQQKWTGSPTTVGATSNAYFYENQIIIYGSGLDSGITFTVLAC